MLDKLAQLSAVRESEVRGCLAAFVDSGIMKVASEEDFDALASAVSSNIGLDYDIDTIYKTAAYLIGEPAEEAQEKTAEEFDDTAYKAALGELLLMKTAGQIDDNTFVSEYDALTKEAAGKMEAIKAGLGAAKKMVADKAGIVARKVKEVAKAPVKNIAEGRKSVAAGKAAIGGPEKDMINAGRKQIAKGVAQVAGGAGAAGLGAALYAKHSK